MSNTIICHPVTGERYFGAVPEKNVSGILIPGAPIVLKRGKHGPKGGFGVRHIWARHEPDLRKRGYMNETDVARYVADIVTPGSPIYCEFNSLSGMRISVVRSRNGLAVLEYRSDFSHYSVVTAFSHRQAHGTRIGAVEHYAP